MIKAPSKLGQMEYLQLDRDHIPKTYNTINITFNDEPLDDFY